jgi:hypothetical protein
VLDTKLFSCATRNFSRVRHETLECSHLCFIVHPVLEPQVSPQTWQQYIATEEKALHVKDVSIFKQLYPLSGVSYHIAPSLGDLCRTLLLDNKPVNFAELMTTNFTGEGPAEHCHPLLAAAFKDVAPLEMWSDWKEVKWLTPQIALNVWNVLNDPRQLQITPTSAIWDPNARYLGYHHCSLHPHDSVYRIIEC